MVIPQPLTSQQTDILHHTALCAASLCRQELPVTDRLKSSQIICKKPSCRTNYLIISFSAPANLLLNPANISSHDVHINYNLL